MAQKEIGKVIHYFDKAGVAVVKLSGALDIGDTVKFKKGDKEFSQVADSMQIDKKPIQSAKAGEEVAVKVSEKAKAGTIVFKE